MLGSPKKREGLLRVHGFSERNDISGRHFDKLSGTGIHDFHSQAPKAAHFFYTSFFFDRNVPDLFSEDGRNLTIATEAGDDRVVFFFRVPGFKSQLEEDLSGIISECLKVDLSVDGFHFSTFLSPVLPARLNGCGAVQPGPDLFREDLLVSPESADLRRRGSPDTVLSAVGAAGRDDRVTENVPAGLTCADLHDVLLF